MLQVTTSVARKGLSDLLNRATCRGKRTLILRGRQKLGALVSVEDLEALEALENAAAERAYDEARAAPDSDALDWNEVKEHLGL